MIKWAKRDENRQRADGSRKENLTLVRPSYSSGNVSAVYRVSRLDQKISSASPYIFLKLIFSVRIKMFRQMISESEIEFKELSLEEEKLNSDIDNEEILKNQAIKKSIKVSPRKMFDSLAPSADTKTWRCWSNQKKSGGSRNDFFGTQESRPFWDKI